MAAFGSSPRLITLHLGHRSFPCGPRLHRRATITVKQKMRPSSQPNCSPHHTGISGPDPMESPAHLDWNTHLATEFGAAHLEKPCRGARKAYNLRFDTLCMNHVPSNDDHLQTNTDRVYDLTREAILGAFAIHYLLGKTIGNERIELAVQPKALIRSASSSGTKSGPETPHAPVSVSLRSAKRGLGEGVPDSRQVRSTNAREAKPFNPTFRQKRGTKSRLIG